MISASYNTRSDLKFISSLSAEDAVFARVMIRRDYHRMLSIPINTGIAFSSPRVETSPFRAAFADNRIIDFCLKITIILS